jgi:DNA-binding transcriptional ArsR family regulator
MDADLLSRVRREIDERLGELRPLVEEYERLLSRNGAGPVAGQRAPRGTAQQAIVAALEHGSHAVSELAVVTGMRGPSIRENLRRLLAAGAVTRGKREGRAAYELSARR